MTQVKYILVFSLLIMCSCNKFLNTTPTGVYTTASYYNTPAEMQQALNACYGGFWQQQLYGQVIGFNFDANNDEEQGNTTNATLSSKRGTAYTFDASFVYVQNLWRFFYIQITDCNYLLANIGKPSWSSQEAENEVEGQALFIRAFCYFNLAINYGGVPIFTTPVSINDVNNPRATLAQVYAQIISDLNQAQTLLQNFTLSTNSNGYATETAVQALLAKVYLYMAGYPTNDATKYDSCMVYCQKVINSGLHSLNPDYSQIFKNLAMGVGDGKEVIWEMQALSVASGVSSIHANVDIGNFVGASSSYLASDTTSYNAVGWVYATKTLYDSYGVDPSSAVTYPAQGTGATGRIAVPNSFDTRRDWNVSPYHYSVTGTSPNQIRITTPWPYPWQMYTNKFDRQYVPLTARQNGVYGIHFPFIRYADVLLMYAEAYNQIKGGPGVETGATTIPTDATDAINMVRRRGRGTLYGNVLKSIIITNGGSGYTSTPTITISGGGGTGAAANAIVVNGVVTGINITQRGALTVAGPYYTSAPTVTISGGGGTGATATATISSSTDADLPQLSQTAFLQAIKDERRREMCFEACRRFDLIRWGGYSEYLQNYLQLALTDGCNNAVSGNTLISTSLPNMTQKTELLPVPLYDLQLNSALVQNPGW